MAQVTVNFSAGAESVTSVLDVDLPSSAGNVYVIDALTAPWSNQINGSTPDQTASILAQINAVPDGVLGAPNVIRFPVGKSQGKYYTQGDLPNNYRGVNCVFKLLNRKHLIIEGPSPTDPATFYTTSPAVAWDRTAGGQQSGRRHWLFHSCSDITFRNIRVEGSNYTFGQQLAPGVPAFWWGGPDTSATPTTRAYRVNWEQEHAFEFSGCTRIVFEDCQAQDIWGDGLTLGSGPTGRTSQFVGRRFSLAGPGRQGVALTRCADVLLDNFELGTQAIRNRRAGFDLEPAVDPWVVERVEISNCTIWMGSLTSIASGGSSRVDDINIHHNTFMGGTGGRVFAQAPTGVVRKNWTIAHNVWTSPFGSDYDAMSFKNINGVTLEDNDVPLASNRSHRLARFENCSGGILIKNNRVPGGSWVNYLNSSVPQLIDNVPQLTLRNY